ncbi:glycosyltransferase [Paenisporosarcina antarctica]|uniref:Glycosyltransferase n=1 Tax=Paenisporosarcina antarctica TaxID=417367 RepID=A0A4P7A1I4_9BACL|nr:glycosyltransferase [Paenisporosarcina antarctica]QBP42468.1 glycosyltransferase [Paenisporosarcina antarctica]
MRKISDYIYSRRKNKKTNLDFDGSHKHFVFENNSNKRWSVIISVFSLLVICALLITFLLGLSVYINPILPQWKTMEINEFSTISQSEKRSVDNSKALNTTSNEKFLKDNVITKDDFYAFYVNWDINSERSLRRNIDQIDVLIPQWFHLNSELGLESDIQKDIGDLAKKHDTKVLPLINNTVDGEWNQEIIHKLLNSPKAQLKLIKDLHKQIEQYGYHGINIDFENIKESDRDKLSNFMKELYSTFHASGLLVTIDVPPDNQAFDYNNLEKYSDRMILMLYDESFINPGPIASSSWYVESLSKASKEKLIVSLGNYGYDWDWESKKGGKAVSFEEIMRIAEKANLKVEWDDMSKNPYIKYKDKNKSHELWFLDSATFHNQWKMAISSGAKGVALWRLGTEDPSIWDIVKGHETNQLLAVKNGDITYYSGEGSIFRTKTDQHVGERSLDFDESGLITAESYISMPKVSEIERLSKISKKNKEIVLTFDDGPDPIYTKIVLDILKEHQIRATFFMLGKNAKVHQSMVKEIYSEGHEIGNHTYSHPSNINKVSYNQLKLELNTTQRIIQGITGRSPLLYRTPYGDDQNTYNGDNKNIYDKSHFQRMMEITQMGYITVDYDIDSKDWQTDNSKEIVDNVIKNASNGDIILLHDGGGDRTSTVQALPEIIEKLQSKGFKFVTVSELMDTKRESIMPNVAKVENPLMQSIKVALVSVASFNNIIFIIIYSALFIFAIRLPILFYLAFKHKKHTKISSVGRSINPLVSVVISAYNEEKVISRTIDSVLKSNYVNFEVIVVDDGSIDQTSVIVSENFANSEKVHLINKMNGGKASAINMGIKKANGDIIIAVDADTIISPEAISYLVRHFIDEKVAAVSGNIKVGNMRNLLTIWQHVEYVTGFNLEKRAFALLNCVTVVPGAIGAWRKQVIEELGYFTDDTLAEDTDMSLKILCKGYKITIDEQAYAYTEVPENSNDFLKQRYRWNFGTLQCFWKHKKAFCGIKQKSLGFIALPNMMLFQFVFPLFAPFIDIVFVLGMLSGNIKKSLLFYSCYLLTDFLICLFAFRLEKLSLKPLIPLFFQRIFYRYLLLWVSWKSILAALKGTRVGWNKLKRSGNLIRQVVKR